MGISCPFEAAVCLSATLFEATVIEAIALEVALLLFFDSPPTIRLERFRGCMDASAEVTVADGGGAAVAVAAAGVVLVLVLLPV